MWSSSKDSTGTHWAQGSDGQPDGRGGPGSLTFILATLEPTRCRLTARSLSYRKILGQNQLKYTREDFATARLSQGENMRRDASGRWPPWTAVDGRGRLRLAVLVPCVLAAQGAARTEGCGSHG